MITTDLPGWAVVIKNEVDDEVVSNRLVNKLQGMFEMYAGQPAGSQKEWSDIYSSTNKGLSSIGDKTSKLLDALSEISQTTENAIYFGYFNCRNDDRTSAELFLPPLLAILETLNEAIGRAIQQRKLPAHRPKSFVLRFWIDRLVDVFYQCAPDEKISYSKRSLFYRVAVQYLADLELYDENLQRTLKEQFSVHSYLNPQGH